MSITNIPGVKEQVDRLVIERTNEGAGVHVTYLRKRRTLGGQDHLWVEETLIFPDMDEAKRSVRELAHEGARCIRVARRGAGAA